MFVCGKIRDLSTVMFLLSQQFFFTCILEGSGLSGGCVLKVICASVQRY